MRARCAMGSASGAPSRPDGAARRGARRRRSRRSPRATPTAASRRTSEPTLRVDVDPRARALQRVVRAVPALGRRRPARTAPSRDVRGAAALRRGDGLRRAVPAADPSDRRDASARAATTRWSPRPATSAAPGRSAPTEGGHKAIHPRARHARGFPPPASQPRARIGIEIALDIAFQCAPDHPYVQRASGVVPPAARRHACSTPRIRRRSTRTSIRSTSRREDWQALWRELKSVFDYWIGAGRAHLPRRQSAHQAVRVLGMADRARCKREHPDVDLPRRGVHAAEGRCTGWPSSASRSRTPTSPGATPRHELTEYFTELTQRPGARVLPPQLLAEHAGHPARVPADRRPRRRSCARLVLAATLSRELRHLRPGLRADGARAARAGQRGISRLGEVPAAALGPATRRQPAPLIARVNAHPPRQSGAAAATGSLRFHADRQRAAASATRRSTRTVDNVVARRRQPRSAPHAVGLGRRSTSQTLGVDADSRLPGARPADRRALPAGSGARNFVAARSGAARRRTSSACAAACAASRTSTIRLGARCASNRSPPMLRAVDSDRTLDDPLWYKDAIIYQLHVKAFCDTNGDGIGDFRGLTAEARLHPGPRRQHDLAAAVLSVAAARRRLRHRRLPRRAPALRHAATTSAISCARRTGAACASSPSSSSTTPPTSTRGSRRAARAARARPSATATCGATIRHEVRRHAHHLHRHREVELDLGSGREAVLLAPLLQPPARPQLRQSARRCSAVIARHALLARHGRRRPAPRRDSLPVRARGHQQREPARDARGPEAACARELDRSYSDRILLAEANQWPEDVREYFGDGDECHMAYHFPLMPRMYMAIAQEDRHPIVEIMAQTPDIPDNCQWAIFLRNHDELTLEMVTERERDYMYQHVRRRSAHAHQRRHPPPPRAADGERPAADRADEQPAAVDARLADHLLRRRDRHGRQHLSSATATACARRCSGAPTATPASRAPIRSACTCRRSWTPIYGYQAVNVEAQTREPSSLLQLDAAAASPCASAHQALRPRHAALPAARQPQGARLPARVRGRDRSCAWPTSSRSRQPVELDLSRVQGTRAGRAARAHAVPADRRAALPADAAGHRLLLVRARDRRRRRRSGTRSARCRSSCRCWCCSTAWMAALSSASDVPRPARADARGACATQLEREVLPRYLAAQRWYARQGPRRSRASTLREQDEMDDAGAAAGCWRCVAGRRSPTAAASTIPCRSRSPGRRRRRARCRRCCMHARARAPAARGSACSTTRSPTTRFCRARRRGDGAGDDVRRCTAASCASRRHAAHSPRRAGRRRAAGRASRLEQSNTLVVLGEQAVPQGLRRLRPASIPSSRSAASSPRCRRSRTSCRCCGALEYVRATARPTALALLQAYVQNQGDGWDYTRRRICGASSTTRCARHARRDALGATRCPARAGARRRRGDAALAARRLPRADGDARQRTAELHARSPARPATRRSTPSRSSTDDVAALARSSRPRSTRRCDLLAARGAALPEHVRADAAATARDRARACATHRRARARAHRRR